MDKKLILYIFASFLLIGIASANLGTFKQTECINIVTNLNASAVNISGVVTPAPNSYIAVANEVMTKQGNFFNYTFCNTTYEGTYTYGYCSDVGECYSNDFIITPSGFKDTTGFYWFIIAVSGAIIMLGFYLKSPVITVLGTIGLYFVGLHFIRYGFADRLDVGVIALSTVILALAFIISIKSVLEIMEEGLG